MKNKLLDLNNHLFAELERLGDETLKGADLKLEITRARALSNVARQVVDGARLSLDAQKLAIEYKDATGEDLAGLPEMIGYTIDGDTGA